MTPPTMLRVCGGGGGAAVLSGRALPLSDYNPIRTHAPVCDDAAAARAVGDGEAANEGARGE